jgi:hypothetical protein
LGKEIFGRGRGRMIDRENTKQRRKTKQREREWE